ncbi:MAG: hypothetical protein ACP5NS_02135 [Candidatus Pacearchaeota archaeon]
MKWNEFIPLAILGTAVAIGAGYSINEARETETKVGTVRQGPYSGANYRIEESPKERVIILTKESNLMGPERLYLRAMDEKKDGIYESIEVELVGKENSRSLGHIPTDLAGILAEANIK